MTKRKNRWNRNVIVGESPIGYCPNAYTGGASVLANVCHTFSHYTPIYRHEQTVTTGVSGTNTVCCCRYNVSNGLRARKS
jgi:hypothetical protein